jgi:glycosyltransferase involved in cell wall biosynthesis
MPDISVVIPTRNRAALLGACLASLAEQTLDPARYEVCVVDNGSTDTTAAVVERVKSHYPQHRIFRIDETVLGLSPARNAGLRATTAPFVASTDDDATVPPDWLERFLSVFAAQGEQLCKIGGDVIPVWGVPRPQWLTDAMLPLLSAATGFGDQPRYMNEGLLECNSCYRRAPLETAGGFPESLGRKGNSLLSAEHAVDLVMNVAGWKLYYDPAITVRHNIHADRLTPLWFRRRYFWQGVSDFAVRAYLKSKGITPTYNVKVEMPFDPQEWSFVNNANEPPVEERLQRLRSLGFVLASSGLIPVD